MASSLDFLTRNLVGGGNKMFGFENCSEKQYELLTRKGVYPYEHITSWDRFEDTELPPIESFYSSLNMSGESDYQHAQQIWEEFGIRNVGDYHDLYLRTDVVLLANVFEAFRDTCLKHYLLDPTHFYTVPGLAWKACLKKTGVRLELLMDPDMLVMFERGIRGGITQVVHRYASANNKYMSPLWSGRPKVLWGSGSHTARWGASTSNPMGDLSVELSPRTYDPSRESTYLKYLNTNNLYGWAMLQLLPTSKFKWIEIDQDQISDLTTSKIKGYLLEVDVRYPTELHDSHNYLPFMYEKMKINKVEILVPNLRNKKNYVIYILVLDQVLRHGLVLGRIHRAIEFNQTDWMKPYIDFNTKLRTAATNDFEKDFFKLMNNSVFGKTMENIRKHGNIKLVTSKDKHL